MTSESDKQGYLGDLEHKPLPELKDLLARQEKIISNVKFVDKLPDKGEKIRRMIDQLHKIIDSHNDVDQSAVLFEKLSLKANQSQVARGEQLAPVLKDIINTEVQEKIVRDERDMETDNSFAKIMKKADVVPDKQKYQPYRTVKHSTIKDLDQGSLPIESTQKETDASEKTKREQTEDHLVASENLANRVKQERKHATLQDMPVHSENMVHKLKYNYDESLMASLSWSNESARKAKLITVEESLKVLDEQKRRHEDLRARQAVEKLTQRMVGSTAPFDPEGSRKMAYRVHMEDSDEDVCAKDSDDEQELDYPE